MLTPGATQILAVGVLVTVAGYAAVVDARTMIISDAVNLILFTTGLVFAMVLEVPGAATGLLASICGAGILYAVKASFQAYCGKEGLGLGDVKFMAAAGPWIGLEGIPLMLLIACSTALIYIAQRHTSDPGFDAGRPVPFGPFLALGVTFVGVIQILGEASWLDLILS